MNDLMNHRCQQSWYIIILPPFQNECGIVDARLIMKWSIIHTIKTIFEKIAQWESEEVHFIEVKQAEKTHS